MADFGWSAATVARLLDVGFAGPELSLSRVVIDSREDCAGALFVALRGERFDGHDFVGEAARRGAVAAVVEREPALATGLALIRVDNALAALQRLGAARRAEFGGTVAAITGSSGKTTTRSLLASILGVAGPTHQPRGNFNNHIGLPLTLLGLHAGQRFAVLELGCSGFGEIAALTALARPDLGLVTNVGPAHLEQLGDLDGVARAKGELLAGLAPGAVALFNADDPRVLRMPTAARRRVTWGRGATAEVRLVDREPRGASGQRLVLEVFAQPLELLLPLIGSHNAINAVAAAAAAFALGQTAGQVAEGLSLAARTAGRLDPRPGRCDALILDDTYNANPASVRAALGALAELAGRGEAVVVLGDMLELGDHGEREHRDIGGVVAALEPALLVTMGLLGAEIGRGAAAAGLEPARIRSAGDHEAARRIVEPLLGAGRVVLVKGSRGMR
ncbi:MAG TPA: UDP-N-acetylmuramoyl-tripeptide--D-alanyl-D-alanine ligase, partial [Polyangia bacterium]|nr:UDP-N-acetylmuramoyl-tripeptide--D-alanyl-D-alanine ligase [Polyangia bacterium]